MRICKLKLRDALVVCALAGTVVLAGCADAALMRADNIARVQAGMNREDVVAIMGPPQRQETFGDTDFLIYSNDGTSTTALLNFTPIAIVDGRVTGMGQSLYDAVRQAHSGRALMR